MATRLWSRLGSFLTGRNKPIYERPPELDAYFYFPFKFPDYTKVNFEVRLAWLPAHHRYASPKGTHLTTVVAAAHQFIEAFRKKANPQSLDYAKHLLEDFLPTLEKHLGTECRRYGTDFSAAIKVKEQTVFPDGCRLGFGSDPGGFNYRPVILTDSDRERHVYILGKSGTGKSTLLLRLMRYDLTSGKGLCFIDPQGDAAKDLLRYIPPDRIADTIYFEPRTVPIGLHAFNVRDDEERERLYDDYFSLFRRLSENWGDRMDAICRYSILSLLSVPGTTFLDLYFLLHDDDYRSRLVSRLQDRELRRYWEDKFPNYPPNATEPLLSRLAKFYLSPTLRAVVGGKNALDLEAVMNTGKVLVVDLGTLGDDTKSILGSLLVSQIQLATRRRAQVPPEQRRPFALYIDEFHNFTSSDFGRIFEEARKYKLHLTVTNHFPHQLTDNLRRTVLGLVGTVITFQLGVEDAPLISKQLGCEPEELIHLTNTAESKYACIKGIERLQTFRAQPLEPPEALPTQVQNAAAVPRTPTSAGPETIATAIIENSKRRYAGQTVAGASSPVSVPEDVPPSPPPKGYRT